MDQRLAIEWTQQNIAKFGGDSGRIVIWGQSAGSTSVDLYNFAYPEDPIIKGLIMDSGTAHLDLLLNADTTDFSSFSIVAANVGCANQTTAAAELECMRKVSAEDLEAFVAYYEDYDNSPSINFIPMVDGVLVFENYTERANAGNISHLVSTCRNTGVFLLCCRTIVDDPTKACPGRIYPQRRHVPHHVQHHEPRFCHGC